MQNVAGKKAKDISKPLKNSFIHTGHGSHRGKAWGSPGQIDDVYLRNPMTPPDIQSNADGTSPNTSTENKRVLTGRVMRTPNAETKSPPPNPQRNSKTFDL